jgi:hypothetical protein
MEKKSTTESTPQVEKSPSGIKQKLVTFLIETRSKIGLKS